MLGHTVYQYFKEKGYDVVGTTRDIFDAETDDIKDIIEQIKPDVVINCIGILNKACEENKQMAIKINGYLPHYLDCLSRKYNFYFIQVSTDCVFEGTIGKYDETSKPDATSFYGRTKALGETNSQNGVTLRTSIVGPDISSDGIGLFKWFMDQTDSVYGYSNVMWTGVTTIELAKQMEIAIKNKLTGLHHVVNNEFISKKDLLELFNKYFEKNIEIKDDSSVKCNKTLVKTRLSYNFNIPTYDQMIREMKEWEDAHR